MVPALKLGNFHRLLRTQYHSFLVIKCPAGALEVSVGDVYRRWRSYPLFLFVTPRPAPFCSGHPARFFSKQSLMADALTSHSSIDLLAHTSVSSRLLTSPWLVPLSRRLRPVYFYTVVVYWNGFWIGVETPWFVRLWDTDRQAEIQTLRQTCLLNCIKDVGIMTGIMWSHGNIASSVVCLSSDYMQHGVKTTKINICSNFAIDCRYLTTLSWNQLSYWYWVQTASVAAFTIRVLCQFSNDLLRLRLHDFKMFLSKTTKSPNWYLNSFISRGMRAGNPRQLCGALYVCAGMHP